MPTQAQEYIRSLPFSPGVPFSKLYPQANPLALDLLSKLLAFDPTKRITCTEALRHPYLSIWYVSLRPLMLLSKQIWQQSFANTNHPARLILGNIDRHDPADEILCPTKFDFSFEHEETTEGMKNLIVEEVRHFRQMVRAPPPQRQGSGSKRQET